MFVNLKNVAQTLNIKLDSLFKVLERCGYSRRISLSKDDTKKLINCLSSKKIRYNTKKLINVLRLELERLS